MRTMRGDIVKLKVMRQEKCINMWQIAALLHCHHGTKSTCAHHIE